MGAWRHVRRLALVGAMVAASSCGDDGSDAQTTHRIVGRVQVEIYDQSINKIRTGRRCTMSPRYRPGAQVLLRDGRGTTLAVGTMSGGIAEDSSGSVQTQGIAKYCTFNFEIADAPAADFYQFTVAGRDVYTASSKQLEAAGWRVQFAMTGR